MTIRRVLSEEELGGFLLGDCAQFLFSAESIFQSPESDAPTDEVVFRLASEVRRFASAFLHLSSAAEDIEKAQRILRQGFAKRSGLSKSEHFHLAWFLIQNLCYSFEERLKSYFNVQKQLVQLLSLNQNDWLRGELRAVNAGMGEAIRERGKSVHIWPMMQPETELLSAIEIINSSSENAEFDLDGQSALAKDVLVKKSNLYIETAFASVRRCFLTHEPTPPVVVREFNSIVTRVASTHSKVGETQ